MFSPAAHGWNIELGATLKNSELVRRLSGWLERLGLAGVVHARCWVLRDRARLPSLDGGAVGLLTGLVLVRTWFGFGVGHCSSVENYIVDASILEMVLRDCFTRFEAHRFF